MVDAFDGKETTVVIYVGMVEYLDYEKGEIEGFNNDLLPSLHKRKSFRHEQELRVVALGADYDSGRTVWDLREFSESGLNIRIDLDRLVESFYVAPGMPDWIKLAVTSP